ncbi:RicAFT regulatory complex protein RicA family protein [Brevibacillus choshinensis]|uniref:Master regulator for biofilm formation n=2 Tax=Brevibacillus choshinensis TaxID=54911 RepID=A0ABR5N1Y1_BRECH|nr:YlbF family regulator [Brevibacillus choshinensis]KQL44481.1 master regulator for biofilm formation [Brevibacillus choshinensis]MED4582153.1 YlbF family regulator [Brevibacillus choshinensis]MED4750221.1 YlbF family regulator [Brevibacillus choshinensis]MED4780808.1 YlbF family regulator [Brevibacillus choshinensis]
MEQTNVFTQKEILDKARELASMISRTNEVDFFKRAELQIKHNERVQELIDSLKQKQKQMVMFESINKPELLKKVEDEFNQMQDELDAIPIVNEFKQSQVDVNDLLQMVTNVITNTVSERIILDTGGNPLTGETGGGPEKKHDGGCCS